MTQLRISAKNLGELARPEFCPRCFWLRAHAKRLPFQIFPGIFSSIDAYTKRAGRERGQVLHYSTRFYPFPSNPNIVMQDLALTSQEDAAGRGGQIPILRVLSAVRTRREAWVRTAPSESRCGPIRKGRVRRRFDLPSSCA